MFTPIDEQTSFPGYGEPWPWDDDTQVSEEQTEEDKEELQRVLREAREYNSKHGL